MKVTLFTIFTILFVTVGFSQIFTVDELDYEVIDADANQVELTGSELTGDIIIPETVTDGDVTYTVTSIGASAFESTGLTSVVIPPSVTSIGSYAFSNNSLESIEIPASVTSIGNWAFRDNSLESVVIPDSVTSIEVGPFDQNNLSSVVIPPSVTSIGSYAFSNNSLESIEIPDSVTSIGNWAFSGNSLESVEIGDSVTSIGNNTFYDNVLESVVIPDSVISIGNSAFRFNDLTNIIIGSGAETIGDLAFRGNGNLASVTSKNTVPPSLGTTVFPNISSSIPLYVPLNTTQAYIDAGWTMFSSIEEVETLSTEEFNNELDQITAYPNPILNELHLSGKTENIQAIKIFNVNGTLVKELSSSSLTNAIAVDYLSSGIYFLKLVGEQSSTTLKVIKQ